MASFPQEVPLNLLVRSPRLGYAQYSGRSLQILRFEDRMANMTDYGDVEEVD